MRASLAPNSFCPKNEPLLILCCRKERGGTVVAGIGDLAGFPLCRFRLILVRIFCQS
jgi:hypothetical protein